MANARKWYEPENEEEKKRLQYEVNRYRQAKTAQNGAQETISNAETLGKSISERLSRQDYMTTDERVQLRKDIYSYENAMLRLRVYGYDTKKQLGTAQQMHSAADNKSKIFSPYKSADEYNSALKAYQAQQAKKARESAFSTVEDYDRAIADIEKNSANMSITKRLRALWQKKTLENQRDKLQKEQDYKQYSEAYDRLKNNSNYNENVEKGKQMYQNTDISDAFKGKNDIFGTVKKLYGAGESLLNQTQMSDEEKNNYYYILSTQGKDEADNYLDFLKSDLNKRFTETVTEPAREFASKNGGTAAAASALSVATNLPSGIGYIDAVSKYLDGESVDENSLAFLPANATKALREGAESTIKSNTGKFFYNTGMSMADFLTATLVSGGMGAGAGASEVAAQISEAANLGIMGANAASSQIVEAKQRGLSDKQAVTLGSIAGLAEIVTEKISIETLLNKIPEGRGSLAKALLYVGKNIGVEGAEEVGSDVINLIADILVSKGQSQVAEAYQNYKDYGLSDNDAIVRVITDEAQQMGLDFLGGALSGGVMAGGAVGITSAQRAQNSRNIGKFAVTNDLNKEMLISQAESLEFDDSRSAVKQAEKVESLVQELKNADTSTPEGQKAAQKTAAKLYSEIQNSMDYVKESEPEKQPDAENKPSIESFIGDEIVWELPEDGDLDSVPSFKNTKPAEAPAQTEESQKAEITPEQLTQQQSQLFDEISSGLDSYNFDDETKAQILNAYTPDFNGKAEEYVIAAKNAIQYGKWNTVPTKNDFYKLLSPAQQKTFFEIGRNIAKQETLAKQAQVEQDTTVTVSKSGKVHLPAAYRHLDKARKAQVSVLARLNQNFLHGNIYFFESVDNGEGNHTVLYDVGSMKAGAMAPNGNIHIEERDIYIDLNSGNKGEGLILSTAAHEFLHDMARRAPKEFKALSDYLMKTYNDLSADVEEMVEHQKNLAKEYGREISDDEAFEEVVARSMERMLADPDVAEKLYELKQTEPKVFERIKAFFEKLYKHIVGLYKNTTNSLELEYLSQAKDQLEMLKTLFSEGLYQAGENAQKAANTESDKIKYSVREDVNGDKYVQVDNDIFNGQDGKSHAAVIQQYIANEFNNLITVNGQDIRINSKTNGEWRMSASARKLSEQSPEAYYDKLRAIAHSDEILQIANDWINEQKQHKNTNQFVSYGRGLIKYRVDNKGYIADVIVGVSLNGSATLYDLVNIKQTKITDERVTRAQESAPRRSLTSVEDSISDNSENVNTKFSLRDNSDGEQLTKAQQNYFKDSKIRDEDGRLLVVYHGTDKDFTVFDRTKGRSTMDIQGSFFSPWEIDAKGYGEKVDKYYLNIKNPAPEVTAYKALNKFKGQNDAGVKAREYLESLGYDGVNNSDEEYIAFNPNQIKRVDNLDPTADSDVRYSVRDDSYMQAVSSGDTETAQRMVDEAAKDAGYDKHLYHGSKSGGGFTVFKGWQYFTENEQYAKRYTERSGKGLYNVFVKADRLFDTRRPEDRKIFDQYVREYGLGEIQDSGFPDWTDGYDLSEIIEENDLDYDGIILDEGGDMVDGKPVSRGVSYVIRNSEQVKSAEAVTYDDNGDVIPLSERFNSEKADIRYSLRDYSYEALTSKPDMKITKLSDNIPKNRADIVYLAKHNAAKIGKIDKSGTVSVYVDDIKSNVIIGTDGLRHGLRRTTDISKNPNSIVTVQAGKIIKNSIRINEIIPTKKNATSSYILIGFAKDKDNSYIVRSVVNSFNKELDSMDVLYALNTKKESAALNAPRSTAQPLSVTDSVISISDLLDYVNKYFPDVLPEDVLKHYGHESRPRGTFSEDILFSNRDYDSASEEVTKQLEKENKKLREDLKNTKELLSLQSKQTGNKVLKRSSVEAAARQLIKTNLAFGDSKEFADVLYDTYSYISNADDLTWEGVSEQLDKAVDWIKSHPRKSAKVKDADAQAILSQLRNTSVSLSETQMQEAEYAYGSFNNYRKAMFGKIKITKDGISLEEMWDELSSAFPDVFDRSVTEGDQIYELEKGIKALQNSYVFLGQDELSRREIADSIYDMFWNVATLNTVADKYAGDIAKLKIKHRQQMDELREDRNDKIEKLKTDQRERIANLRRELKERNEREVSRLKESYKNQKESRKVTELRHKIIKIRDDFQDRLLRGSDTRFVPKDLVNGVIEVCNAIDPTGKKQDTQAAEKYRTGLQALSRLKLVYDNLKIAPDYDFSSEFNESFSQSIGNLALSIGDTPLRDMSLTQLEDVYSILHEISAMLKDANKLIGLNEKITIYEAGQNIISNMRFVVKNKLTTSKISDLFREWTLNPMRAIKEMSGYDEKSTLYKIFNDINLGLRKKEKFVMNATKPFEELRDSKEKKQKFRDAVEKPFDFGLKDENGNKLMISKMQAFLYILTFERGQANEKFVHQKKSPTVFLNLKDHIKGKNQKAIDNGQRLSPVTLDIITKMTANLDAWDMAYLDAARNYFRHVSTDAINETSMILKHKPIATEKCYVPSEIDKDYVSKDSDNLKYDATIEGMGMLKSLAPNASQPLIMRGLNEVISDHIESVGKYYGLAIPIRNANKVFNMKQTIEDGGSTVKTEIRKAWGNGGLEMWDKTVADLQSPRRTESSKLVSTVKSGWVTATLANRISITMKQAASYPTAGAILSNRSLLIGLKALKKKKSPIYKEIDTYTAAHWKRRQGLSVQELGEIKQSKGWQNWLNDKTGKLSPMNWIQDIDVDTTALLWEACKAEISRNGIKKGSTFFKDTADLYDKVIEETQPVYDSLHRAEVTKNSVFKNVILFKTQPLQNSGILHETAMELKVSKKKYGNNSNQAKEASRKFRKAVSSQLVSHIVFVTMSWVSNALSHKMNPYRDDDDELTFESTGKELAYQLFKNVVYAVVPIFGEYLVAAIEKLVGKNPYDVVSDSVISMVNDTIESFSKLDEPSFENYASFACDIASFFGIPAGNAKDIVEGIILHIKDALNGEFLSFEAGIDRTNTQNANIAYKAIISGNEKKLLKVKKQFDSQSEYQSAVRAALRDNDKRITEAAKAKTDGDLSGYEIFVKEIESEGHFSRNDIVKAVTSAYNKLNKQEDEKSDWWNNETEEEVSTEGIFYNSSDVITYLDNGDYQNAKKIVNDVVNEKVKSGKTQKQARAAVRQSISAHYKQDYLDADEQERVEIRRKMYNSGVYDSVGDITKLCNNWVTKANSKK